MDPNTVKIVVWIAIALLGVWFAFTLKKYFAGVGELSDAQNREEEKFVESAIAEAQREKIEARNWGAEVPPPAEIPSLPPTNQAPPPPPPSPITHPSSPITHHPAPITHHPSLDSAIHRLRALRIIEDREGELPLSVPPNGVLYRMRRGGTMAILPRVESEASLEHFVKRFDMVVCIAAGGTLVVMERLDSRAVELVDGPGTF
jgi:hypothetical protein